MYTFSASVSTIAAAVTLTMESNKFVRSFSSSSSDSESLKEPLVETADFKRGVLTPEEVSVVDYKNGLKPVIWSITTTHLPRPQLMNLQAPSQSSAPQDRMDIFSLCMPELSASSSLPYLPRLWLRTLAFLVETQNPDTASVMSKVILALWSHLRSVPYPAGRKDIFGKFGDHKRRFFKEPFTLECQAVNQKNHGVYIYYRKQALKFIPQLNFPGSLTDVLSSFLCSCVDSSLCSSEPIEIKADLGVKRKPPLMAGKSIWKSLLTAATSAYSNLSDSESLHVQMIQMMRRCRFLRHVLVFILLSSSWTSVLGFSEELYVDRPAGRSLLQYPEHIDSLFILDHGWTLYLMGQSGKPRWSASYMVLLSVALFIVVAFCFLMFVLAFKVCKGVFVSFPVPVPKEIVSPRDSNSEKKQREDVVIKNALDGPDPLPALLDPLPASPEHLPASPDPSQHNALNAPAPLKNKKVFLSPKDASDASEDVEELHGSVEKLLKSRWNQFLDGKNGKNIGRMLIMDKNFANGKDPSVFEGFCQPERAVAVKRVGVSESVLYNIMNEIYISNALDQDRGIIRLYSYDYDKNYAYFGLEPWTCDLEDLVIFCKEKVQEKNSTKEYLEIPLDGNVLWEALGVLSPVVRDLMRDMACALEHLHSLKVIYRDFKPQNVKIILKGKKLIAKLSNFGNSKRISHEPSFSYPGSKDWQAPEQLHGDDDTYAIDMFNFGCLIYYTITGGLHPFGPGGRRENKIRNNTINITKVEAIPEAYHLISHLLKHEPHLRLSASEALLHPMFWDAEMRLSFLHDASDLFQSAGIKSKTTSDLYSRRGEVLGQSVSWESTIGETFKQYLVEEADGVKKKHHKKYDFKSVRDLLRLVRNTLFHYTELPSDIQELVGSKSDGLDQFFAGKYPRLLMVTYEVVSFHYKGDPSWKKYFQ